jgi:hypothetical protein
MTHYIEEARRLGVAVPVGLEYGGLRNRAKDDEGLCISGCHNCRKFRNAVRGAMQSEEDDRRDAERRAQAGGEFLKGWDAGYEAGRVTGHLARPSDKYSEGYAAGYEDGRLNVIAVISSDFNTYLDDL